MSGASGTNSEAFREPTGKDLRLEESTTNVRPDRGRSMIGPRRRAALAGLWAAAVGLLWLVLAGTVAGQAIPAPTGLTVQASAPTPQHPSVDMTVRWQGIADTSADYEIESAIRRNDSVEPFAPISRAWAPERHPDGTFTILETRAFEPSFDGWMCYRVRAVVGGATGPYSAEACAAGPLAKGTPSTATPPLPTAPTPLPMQPHPPLDPRNPLKVFYAPAEGAGPGRGGEALPSFEGLSTVAVTDIETIRRNLPGAAFLSPEDAAPFPMVNASAVYAADGRFSSSVLYQDQAARRYIRVAAWTKEGEFEFVAPGASPVTRVRQAIIGGLYALTILPTEAVVGGIAQRSVYFTTGDRIYYLEVGAGTFNEDQKVLDIAARLAVRYANVPGAPDTGQGLQEDSGSGISPLVIVGIVVMAASMIAFSFGIALAGRR